MLKRELKVCLNIRDSVLCCSSDEKAEREKTFSAWPSGPQSSSQERRCIYPQFARSVRQFPEGAAATGATAVRSRITSLQGGKARHIASDVCGVTFPLLPLSLASAPAGLGLIVLHAAKKTQPNSSFHFDFGKAEREGKRRRQLAFIRRQPECQAPRRGMLPYDLISGSCSVVSLHLVLLACMAAYRALSNKTQHLQESSFIWGRYFYAQPRPLYL